MGWAARARRRARQDELFDVAVEAEENAARQILTERGLTPEGVLEVAANAHAFAEAMVAAAADKTEPKPACAAGCCWCCHRPLSALPLDVFHAAAAVASLPEGTRERVRLRVEAVAESHARLGERELRELREPCPLLEGGRCSIYEARPAECVARNAADPELCRLDVEERRATSYDGNGAVAILPRRLVEAAEEVVGARLRASRGQPPRPENGERLRFVPALASVLERGVRESVARWFADEPLFATDAREKKQA